MISALPFPRQRQVLPGMALTLGMSLLFIALVLLLPLTGMVSMLHELGWSDAWFVITDPRLVASYKVTLITAAAASLLNGVIGLLLAWVLVRYQFVGRTWIDALVDLPFALPTAVAGITLATLFAGNGWYGQWFAKLGVEVAYTPLGIVVAMVFTSLPFVVRTVQPVLETLPQECEEAAQTLGAERWAIVRHVIWPMLMPAWVSGVGLSFARSLGEFGAVIFIAGNQPYVSEVTSLMIFTRLQEFDLPAASAIAAVVLLLSLVLLLGINAWQLFFYKRYQGKVDA